MLKEVDEEQAADAEFEKLCQEGFDALKEACSKALSKPAFVVAPFDWTPDVVLEPFGSTRQGTALKNSDLDLRMTFEQFEVHRKERQNFYLKGVADGLGAPFEVRVLIDGRVPVLRLRYDDRLDVDLSMGGTFEGGDLEAETVGVDHYIKAVLAAAVDEEIATRFVRLVKIFAKANSLVDAYLGYLSSTSWSLLAISFLQSQRCLPPGSGVLGEGKDGQPRKKQRMTLWSLQISPGLFARFFAYVEKLGESSHKVSVFNGRNMPMHPYTLSGAAQHPLFLEYPSERRKETNVAMTLKRERWEHTVEQCRKARLALRPKGDGPWAARESATMVRMGRFLACVGGDDGKGALPPEAELAEPLQDPKV